MSISTVYGGEPSMPDEKWDPHFYTLNLSKFGVRCCLYFTVQ